MRFGLPGCKRAKYSPEQKEAGLPLKVATLNYRSALEEKKYRRRIGVRTVVLDEEFVPDPGCLSPEEIVINADLKAQLERTFRESKLSRRQRQIAEYMWKDPDITSKTIADRLGISEAAVCDQRQTVNLKLRRTAKWGTKLQDFLRS